VHDAEARVVDVAEDVGREQRRREQEQDVRRDDGGDDHAQRQRARPGAAERCEIAGEQHDQQLRSARRQQHEVEAAKGAAEPVGEAALLARRNQEQPPSRGRPGRQQRAGRQQAGERGGADERQRSGEPPRRRIPAA
jgi:hypothetical protein